MDDKSLGTNPGMLQYHNLGRMEYLAALELQEKLVQLKQREPSADILLFVEHPHVYTLGRDGNESNVLGSQDVPVHRTSRGGDVTYHGPGQLVVYPIVDLRSKLRKDIHRYVKNLELSAIRTLNDFRLHATRRPPYTGIWIGDRKIAAIGVAVRRCITFHGLALNVNTDLSYFNRIIPCGLSWADVTSMARELGTNQNLVEVRERFRHNFAEIFGYYDVKETFDDGNGHTSSANSPTIGTTGTF
ncbi:MAG TPA: lipoyl(octanoyl) transferase LipB [Candidatus Binatia bacterium]|jgi:lipoate-protein ligase B